MKTLCRVLCLISLVLLPIGCETSPSPSATPTMIPLGQGS
jgi:hypothetical protein